MFDQIFMSNIPAQDYWLVLGGTVRTLPDEYLQAESYRQTEVCQEDELHLNQLLLIAIQEAWTVLAVLALSPSSEQGFCLVVFWGSVRFVFSPYTLPTLHLHTPMQSIHH